MVSRFVHKNETTPLYFPFYGLHLFRLVVKGIIKNSSINEMNEVCRTQE